jgi:hypothetical protein
MPPSSTTVSIGRKALPFPTAKAIFWITFWFWVSTSITYSGMRLFEWSRETHYGASALQMIFKVLTEATALLILFAFIGVIVVMPLVLLLKNRPFWWKESVTCTLVTLAVGVIIGIPVIENYVTFDQQQEESARIDKKYGFTPAGPVHKPDLAEQIAKIFVVSLGVGMTTGAMASRFYRANHPSQMAPEA